MSTQNICPICEVGQLSLSHFSRNLSHRGQTLAVDELEAWACESCGQRIYDADQVRKNQVRIAHARREDSDTRRRSRGLLTGDEIRALREELGLTQSEAALLFGSAVNSFSKYERGEVIQSVAIDVSMRGAVQCRSYFLWLLSRVGLSARRHEANVDQFDQSWAQQDTAAIAELLILRPATFEDRHQLFSKDWVQEAPVARQG